MGKGDNYRPVDKEKYDESFERVFGKKKLNVWEDAPPKDGTVEGDSEADRPDGGSVPEVPEDAGSGTDS